MAGISLILMCEEYYMNNIIKALQDKDDKKAYALFKEIGTRSAASDEYYSCFDDFLGLLNAKSSYVGTRGFALCCAQARWDESGKLQKHFQLCLPCCMMINH